MSDGTQLPAWLADLTAHERPVLASLLWAEAALLVPFAYRAAAIGRTADGVGSFTAPAVVADVGLGLLAAAAITALACLRRGFGLTALAAWIAVSHANLEHILANGSNLSIQNINHLLDPTFLRGSGLGATQVATGLVIAAGAGLLAATAALMARRPRGTPALAVAGLLAVAPTLLLTSAPDRPGWTLDHFVLENLRRIWAPGATANATARARREWLRPDLAGDLRVPRGPASSNVLLILVEGLSGGHVASIREANGRTSTVDLPRLDAFARRAMVWTSFVANQRQTSRGEFAILCGTYPKLLTAEPRMTEYARGAGGPCLPASLRELGLETTYLQAAPLTYMLKDRFMTEIGFDRVLGDEWVGGTPARSKWGVDDATFLARARELVTELRDTDRPWFLTLLTVGTHHPYTLPDRASTPAESREGGPRDGSFGHAARVADEALGEFLHWIEAAGILDDTLVLISSDESTGLGVDAEGGFDGLASNWGLLVAHTPARDRDWIAEPFMQVDLPLSILDWLGAEEKATRFSGRSVFRRYSQPRIVGFADTYAGRVGAITRDGAIRLCREDFGHCVGLVPGPGGPFSAPYLPDSEATPEAFGIVRELAGATMAEPAQVAAFELQLAMPGTRTLHPGLAEGQIIFAGQLLDIPEASRLEFELDIEAVGSGGALRIQHDLMSERAGVTWYRAPLPRLTAGQRLQLRYDYETPVSLQAVESRLLAQPTPGSDLALRIHGAWLRVVPDEAAHGRERGRVTVHWSRLVEAAPPP